MVMCRSGKNYSLLSIKIVDRVRVSERAGKAPEYTKPQNHGVTEQNGAQYTESG